MVWVIIGVGLFLVGVICCSKDVDIESSLGVMVLGIMIFAIPIILGISVYPNLVGNQAKALALKSEIETMRSAHYSEVPLGNLIGGSLDNFRQSTILSEYIREYARLKADYNSALMSARVRKELKIYQWLGQGVFISKRIYELEKL